MALPLLQLPMTSSSSSPTETLCQIFHHHHRPLDCRATTTTTSISLRHRHRHRHRHGHGHGHRQLQRQGRPRGVIFLVGKEDTELQVSTAEDETQQQQDDSNPEDLEYVRQIQRVIELLRKNRDMLFSEVKLTVAIEDPRDVERRRLLGIEDPDTPTREELADALEDVNEGRIPENRAALRMLAEEMINWPNLEVEAKKKKPSKSLYAKATDTGVDPKLAAKRLKVDWDSAAEIDDDDDPEETDVPSALGFGALYLVSAFPIIIGISVVLILFYNSLQ
ncbi:hypothetical protein BVC80_3g3 [Macleaya cordata]|uniref:Ycf3-interacting protein 1, chloroplastic n=1 Tax=Macleaya cordata TaxID=56857 RepID=A0A200QXJ1_MACCD|nr:hypothetical protein BVC80_3g3 [Macleaya cordata]